MRYILLGVFLLIHHLLFSQEKNYLVTPTPFSSRLNNEISPVFYKNGIVFCSDLKNNSLITFKTNRKGLFNIFYVAKKDSGKWGDAKLLSKELTTNFNDGPVTFSPTGDTVYYGRNNDISDGLRNVSDSVNQMGIYSAVFIGGKWTDIKPFTYNSALYSLVTPALSPNGKRLYFASDMPGGYGGADLYYCDRKGNGWGKPVNMGPAINTPKNESYPFADRSGKLFFASDGHGGLGGKDIFYTQEINGKWIDPIHLDADINSPYDDFGLVTNGDLESGYFTSNRRKTDDIFRFVTSPVQFSDCDSMGKHDFCYLFYDEFQAENDTAPVIYEWDFGNGIKKYGLQVQYCFPGPGKYKVTLNLHDDQKRDSIVSRTFYNFELKDTDQVYINSLDDGIINEPIAFDGLKSRVPGFKISDYFWDFGNGFSTRGPVTTKTFDKKGEYTVKLGLLGKSDSLNNRPKKCASKTIRIFDDYQDMAEHTALDIDKLGYSYDLQHLADSSDMEDKTNNETEENLNSLRIKVYLMNDLSEMMKKKIVEYLSDIRNRTIEMNETGIDSISYPILAKFSKVLIDDPDIKLEIAVHTGDQKLSGNNLEISEKWAQNFYNWLVTQGVSPENLHCKGYGKSRPEVSGRKSDQDLNKRVEFIFRNAHN